MTASGPTVYVGGRFTRIGGQPRRYLAALDAGTGLATAWDPAPDWWVGNILPRGPTVYVGGIFEIVGGQPRHYLAALDASTGLATDWNPQVTDWVGSLAAIGGTIYVGGGFSAYDASSRGYLSGIDAQTGVVTRSLLTNDFVDDLVASSTTIYAGGAFTSLDGDPFSRLAILQVAGATPVAVAGEVPEAGLHLEQNRPNPFNPRTTLAFTLGHAGRVRITIHDLRGARVATLVDADMGVGRGSVSWDGRTAAGLPAPSGSYLVRLEAGGQVRTAKMTLAR